MSTFDTDYKFKFKHHSILYHFSDPNIYLSLVDNLPCIKGFIGKSIDNSKQVKAEFAPFVVRFLNGDKYSLFDSLTETEH